MDEDLWSSLSDKEIARIFVHFYPIRTAPFGAEPNHGTADSSRFLVRLKKARCSNLVLIFFLVPVGFGDGIGVDVGVGVSDGVGIRQF